MSSGFRIAALLLAVAGSARAQESWTPSRAPRADDIASLDGIIRAFYEVVSGPAGQPRDWTRDSTLYLPGMRFVIANRARTGEFGARVVTHNGFATTAGSGLMAGFFEKEIHRVTNRFGPMIQVFSTYEWRRTENGPVGGRGINAIELFHDGKRWWIASAMWVDEDADNPIPKQYLPGGS